MAYTGNIGNANDKATILADAKTFFSSWFQDSDADEIKKWSGYFDALANGYTPGLFWFMAQFLTALIQVYDLVLPVDPDQAGTYLSRLGAIAGALLANRDDKRNNPMDPFRGRVMRAWGAVTHDRDDNWNTDVSTSGLLVYAMAAFARRVVDRPHLYPKLHAQAIALITAAIETYQAFRPELHLVDGDPFAYFNLPLSYSTLTCSNGAPMCPGYRAGAGKPIAYNENLAMMQALAELALAANSNVYRASADTTPDRLALATEEAPLVVAKNVAWRVSDLRPKSLSDLTPYYEWTSQPNGEVEDTSHAQFELGCLAVILEDQIRLNALLTAAGRPEQVPLDRSMFVRFANTFLRIVWHNNDLSSSVDGKNVNNSNDGYCAGWIPLAQFDPWLWTRARDTAINRNNPSIALWVDSHGALLRYRGFNSLKYLTDFAGQNWLITPAALAVGQAHPRDIRDQKWLLVLSGVVIANLKGDYSGDWNRQTVSFIPDMAGSDDPTSTSGPLNWAISHYNIPKPSGSVGTDYLIRFALEGWSSSVSLGSVYDQAQSINAGFAVDDWRPNHFDSGTDVVTGQPANNIFTGVNADLAVSDSDAWLYRLTYNITLVGKIVFIAPPVIFGVAAAPKMQERHRRRRRKD
jgi:hypothetical protein